MSARVFAGLVLFAYMPDVQCRTYSKIIVVYRVNDMGNHSFASLQIPYGINPYEILWHAQLCHGI